MSTQLEASQDELDRTDELPRLDVAAYEASLAAEGDPLSRTDTWAVDEIQLAEAAEGMLDDASSPASSQQSQVALNRAVTTDVDRILKRIAELEAEVAGSQARNQELDARCGSLHEGRAELEKRVLALEADNARLGEYRALALDHVRKLEQQLLDRSAQHDTRIGELTAARSEERSAAARARELFEKRIAELTLHLTDLEDQHESVQQELQAARDLSVKRAEAIDDLQQSLADADRTAATLGKNLAAKLKECDTAAALIERRNSAIAAFDREREDLAGQLQEVLAHEDELEAKLARAESELSIHLNALNEREHELAEKDRRLDQLAAEIERSSGDAQVASQERDAALNSLCAERQQQEGIRQALAARSSEIEELRNSLQQSRSHAVALQDRLDEANATLARERETTGSLNASLAGEQQRYDTVRAELELAQTTLGTLTAEHVELAPLNEKLAAQSAELQRSQEELAAAQDEIAALHGELQRARDERTMMAVKLDKVRVRTKAMAQEIFRRDNRISSLKSDLAVHTEALDAIRRDVSRASGEPAYSAVETGLYALEPLDPDGAPVVLDRNIMTIGRTHESDVCIPSKLVSRNHARLLVGPNAVIIEDAGSTNGCYVNNREVKRQVMREGDVLQLGDLKYRLVARSPHHASLHDNVVSIVETRRLPS